MHDSRQARGPQQGIGVAASEQREKKMRNRPQPAFENRKSPSPTGMFTNCANQTVVTDCVQMQTLGPCTQPCADVLARSKTGGDIHERQLVAAPAATVKTQRRLRQQHLIDPGFDQGPQHRGLHPIRRGTEIEMAAA